MTGRVPFLLALLMLAGPAWAEHPAECLVAANLIEPNFPLPQFARALAAKRLSILVIGSGSMLLPGADGSKNAYPARLQHALTEMLPGVEVKVVTDVQAHRNAVETVKALKPALAAAKPAPALVVWGIGTVDAIQAIDPDQFSHALDKDTNIARSAGADVVLINAQYSPRTESMITLGTYAEDIRWVALQQEVPVFDRFSIMKLWVDLGTFDLYSATKKLDIAERIHTCIGRLLADFMIEAVKPSAPHAKGGR